MEAAIQPCNSTLRQVLNETCRTFSQMFTVETAQSSLADQWIKKHGVRLLRDAILAAVNYRVMLQK